MPSLSIFHRKTIIGGDDLQPAALLAITVRIGQMIAFFVPLYIRISIEVRDRGSFDNFVFFDPANDDSCRHSHYFGLFFIIYTLSSTIYNSTSVLLESKISYWSSQGAPTQLEPRSSKVRHLLELKLFPFSIILFLIFMTGVSAAAFAKRYYQCKQQEYTGVQYWYVAFAIILATQIGEVLVSWFYMLHLCTQPIDDTEWADMDVPITPNHQLAEQMWADRCASMCRCLSIASCFMFGGREILGQDEFGDIARALADYLEARGVLDVVPSDIVTGFIVLQRLQKAKMNEATRRVTQDTVALAEMERGASIGGQVDVLLPTSPSAVSAASFDTHHSLVYHMKSDGNLEGRVRALLSADNIEDMQFMKEGARYAKYSLAIYTWVLYLYVHPCSGIPRLLTRASCQCCRSYKNEALLSPRSSLRQDYRGRIRGDNVCEVHRAALLLHAGIEDADLVYAQLESGFEEVPYAILLDHEWKTVVLTVRGTFSLEDCVTDVLIQPESLKALGEEFGFDGTDQYCHGGVLACTRNVYRDLRRHGILERLLVGDNACYPDYRLLLTGHSLGAGTCTLLSFMLRQKFPTLRCMNFCPPGCTLTKRMATECKEWCSSFVLDSDLVPRLTVDSMENLRDNVLEIIGKIKVPKATVAKTVGRSLFTDTIQDVFVEEPSLQSDLLSDVEKLLYRDDEIPDSEYQVQLDRFKRIQAERRESRGLLRTTKLYPPGRMVHLLKTGESASCVHGIAKCLTCYTTNSGFEYTPMWIENDDLNEIVVSPTMATDHFPNRITAILQDLAKGRW